MSLTQRHGLFDQAQTPDEMIYDVINIMDSIVQNSDCKVAHASIKSGEEPLADGPDMEDNVGATHLSNISFSLANSANDRPEFIVTGCDLVEAAEMIAICSLVWPNFKAELLAGEPIVLENRLLFLMPVTLEGAASFNDGMHFLRAAEVRLSGEGVTDPNWIQIAHTDKRGRFPWEAGYSAEIAQPLAGTAPRQAPGSARYH